MSAVSVFNTQSVRPWNVPQLDTFAKVNFTPPFVALPRLPLGFRELDIDSGANIRAKSFVDKVAKDSAEYHITTWFDSKLYSGIVNSLDLAPANLEFLSGEYMRNLLANAKAPSSMRVTFERPFVTPPKVVAFFNHIDLDKSKNWRLTTTATDIDTKGFTINVNTWGDTILYAAKAGWIAYPEDEEHIFSASVNTQEVRPWNQPRANQSKSITFGDVEFCKPPQVFMAFNEFDIQAGHNFRLNAYADNTTTTGLTWHINTWFDTVLYSAGASIIAID